MIAAPARARRKIEIEKDPKTPHDRTPLFVGNRDLVEKVEEFIRQHDA